MITLADYYMGRDVEHADELTEEKRANAVATVSKVNLLLVAFGHSRKVNSGFRPAVVNAATVGSAKFSKHMTCQACDISDFSGSLDAWCMNNLEALERIGLWLEHPDSTASWCHVQIVPPGSGNRVFRP